MQWFFSMKVIGKFHDFQTNRTEIKFCRIFITPGFTISRYSPFQKKDLKHGKYFTQVCFQKQYLQNKSETRKQIDLRKPAQAGILQSKGLTLWLPFCKVFISSLRSTTTPQRLLEYVICFNQRYQKQFRVIFEFPKFYKVII